MSDASQREEALGPIVDSFLERFRSGERPAVEEYAARYPELADAIREVLPALVAVEQDLTIDRGRPAAWDRPANVPAQLGDYRIIREIGRGGMGIVYEAVQQSLGRHVALKVLPWAASGTGDVERFRVEARAAARLHHTNIVPVFSVGEDSGTHYFAMQCIRGQGLDQVIEELRRLRSHPREVAPGESTIAARLLISRFDRRDDPVGMAREDGATGSQTSEEGQASAGRAPPGDHTQPPVLGDPSSLGASRHVYFDAVARIVLQVAEALGYAHAQGVLHRDIKPSNLLLDTRGTAWVTDFGLAKSDEAQARTRTGDILGTLRYMAPERFEGLSDPRSDVYGLGATTYELLTLHPLFEGVSRPRLVDLILRQDPVPPRLIDPRVPRDLEVICLKCLAKEPARRYASALALAEDLRSYLDGQPIRARPSGHAERAWKWARRRPLVAGLALAVVAVTVLGVVSVVGALVYALDGWRHAQQQERAAVKAGDELRAWRDADRRRSAQLTLEKGISLAAQGDVARGLHYMRETLVLAPPDAEHLRRLARINLGGWAGSLHGLHLVLEHPEEIKAVAFSPDGRILATGSAAGVAQRWAVATGQPVGAPLRAAAWIWAVAYSPDGQTIATAGGTPNGGRPDRNAGVQFWDAASGGPAGPLLPHTRRVWCVAYHPDGRSIATGSDRSVRLWETATGKLLRELTGHAGDVRGIAFSPDGRLLASASLDGTARLWEAGTGAPLQVLRGHTGAVHAVAVHPDGRSLASASLDGTARLWDVASGQAVGEPLRHPDAIQSLAFTRDGMTLVTGCYDGNARLWNLATGRPWGSSLGHRLGVTSLAVSGDGRSIVTGSQDRTARLWEIGRGLARSAGRGWPDPSGDRRPLRFDTAVYSPDRATVVTAGTQGFAQLWEAASGRPIGRPLEHPRPDVRVCTFSADGKTVATACLTNGVGAGQVRVWDAATGCPRSDWLNHPEEVVALAFSPDGRTLATGDYRYDVRLWDVATGQVRGPAWRQRDIVLSLAFSPDGRTLAAGTANSWHRDPQARLWDVPTGQPRGEPMRHRHWVHFLAFSPDGRALLTGSRDGTARLWDAATAQPLGPPLEHQFEWTCAAFSPGQKTVLTGGLDGVARLWRTADAMPAGPPLAHPAGIQAVAFNPDGQTLLAGCRDGSVLLWDARMSIPFGPPMGQGATVRAVSFTADGQSLLVTADGGMVRSLPMPGPLPGDEAALALWLEIRTGLAMEPAGQAPAPLAPAAWAQRWRRLDELAWTFPFARSPLVADADWHDAAAREAEQAGALFAAGWHLDRLTLLHPDDWTVFARRGRVSAGAGRLDDATAAYRRAESLGAPEALQAWYRHEEITWRLRGREDLATWYAGRLRASLPGDPSSESQAIGHTSRSARSSSRAW